MIPLYEIRQVGEKRFQLYFVLTREIREAESVEILLRELAREYGFYLRRK